MTTNPTARSIVIIEDHTAVREMLAEILRSDRNWRIVGECGEGNEAYDMLVRLKPDMVVLDARLPGMNGTEILHKLGKQLAKTRVLVFSAYDNPALVHEMMTAGAHGYIEKTAGLTEFKRGLEVVASGGTYLSPRVAAHLSSFRSASGTPSPQSRLTAREREILKLVAEGSSTRQIASRLELSVKTVDNHRTNLMRKLDVHNVAGLTRHAIEAGLIQHPGLTP
jgi:DNA-binding NarL/FixJ family response regulator